VHHKTGQYKDIHLISLQPPSPSTAASVPSHQQLIESSTNKETEFNVMNTNWTAWFRKKIYKNSGNSQKTNHIHC